MKLHVLCENLQKKLPFLNHAISSRSQLPVLQNLLLETHDGRLRISSTDLEIGIQTDISADVEKEGGVTLPARSFSDLISALPHEKITLEQEEKTLRVRGSKTTSTFQTTAREEFPQLYEEKGEEIARVNNEEIIESTTPVFFAASQDSGRPALSGVLIQEEENGFLLVATDGYRLSLKHFTLSRKKTRKQTQEEEKEEKPLLVPARLFREVISMKQEGDVGISVSRKNNQILFSQKDTIIVGRIIDAEFPNYQKIIPKEYTTKVIIDREEIQKAVKIASVFARDSSNIIRFSFKKNITVVSANAPSVGENSVELGTKHEGEEGEIAFNARYLLDFFSNITGEEITLEMTGPLSPGVFRVHNDDSFLHIIMPVRVQPQG